MGEKLEKAPNIKGIKPLGKPRSMGDLAYDYLRHAIIKGDIPPGQRLIEVQLSEQMNVSRIPIREAVKKLEQEGLVERSDKRGFKVKNITREEIEETIGIRALLESYAAYLATEHLTDSVVQKLLNSIKSSKKALEKKQFDKVMQLNTQFHEIIYRAAGSTKLYELINDFRDAISRYRRPLLENPDYVGVSLKDHEEMVAAMVKKKKDRVEKLVRKHIMRGIDIILKEMESGKPI